MLSSINSDDILPELKEIKLEDERNELLDSLSQNMTKIKHNDKRASEILRQLQGLKNKGPVHTHFDKENSTS